MAGRLKDWPARRHSPTALEHFSVEHGRVDGGEVEFVAEGGDSQIGVQVLDFDEADTGLFQLAEAFADQVGRQSRPAPLGCDFEFDESHAVLSPVLHERLHFPKCNFSDNFATSFIL